jgi:hypothetical protein
LEDAKKQHEDPNLKNYNQIKLALYFGTQESVYVISKQMGFPHQEFPEFASKLMIELTRDAEKGYMVTPTFNKQNFPIGGD